jgi:hypothetical protein
MLLACPVYNNYYSVIRPRLIIISKYYCVVVGVVLSSLYQYQHVMMLAISMRWWSRRRWSSVFNFRADYFLSPEYFLPAYINKKVSPKIIFVVVFRYCWGKYWITIVLVRWISLDGRWWCMDQRSLVWFAGE